MKKLLVCLFVVSLVAASLGIISAEKASADIFYPISFNQGWSVGVFPGYYGGQIYPQINLSVSATAGKLMIAYGYACTNGFPSGMLVTDITDVPYVTFSTLVSITDSNTHCLSTVASYIPSVTGWRLLRLLWAISGASYFGGFMVSKYTNVSSASLVSAFGNTGASTGHSLSLTTGYNASWVAGFAFMSSCNPLNGLWPTGNFGGSHLTFERGATVSDNIYGDCARNWDDNEASPPGTTVPFNANGYNPGGNYMMAEIELHATTVISPLLINGWDIFSIAGLVIFFSVLCATVWGASRVRHWRGG